MIESIYITIILILISGFVSIFLYRILNNDKVGKATDKLDILKSKYTLWGLFFISMGIILGLSNWNKYPELSNFIQSLGGNIIILGVASFGIEYLLHKEFIDILQNIGIKNIKQTSALKSEIESLIKTYFTNYTHGLIVHPNHRNLLPRAQAIDKYLEKNQTFRVISPNADKYLKHDSEALMVLKEKIEASNCKVQALLYYPVFDSNRPYIKIGQSSFSPQQLINEHKALKDDYFDLMTKYPEKVLIKFFTLPIHFNAMIIGNSRCYSALVMHFNKGREIPCFEMYPANKESLIFKVINDFTSILMLDKEICFDLKKGFEVYENAQYSSKRLLEAFNSTFKKENNE